MLFLLLTFIFQVALAIHVVKTGRNNKWIWIVMILPLAGAIAYLVIEVLPNLDQSNTDIDTNRKRLSNFKLNRVLKLAPSQFERSNTIDNKMAQANTLLNEGQCLKAKTLFAECLAGLYDTDPHIMLGLAKAQFACNEIAEAKMTLDQLIEHNPDFKDHRGHLLYARCLEVLNENEAACQEYEVLRQYYPGPEAKYRYALLCYKIDKPDFAQELFDSIILDAETGGPLYNSMHKEWINQTKARLNSLKA